MYFRCDVKAIYAMARPKREKASIDRLRENYDTPLFSLLKEKDPDFFDRIKMVEGNTRQLGCGLSATDRQAIKDNCEIVIHAAADVRFDNPIQELLMVNLRGTREILNLAKEMPKLIMFAYISTAYSHCPNKNLEERCYKSPADPDEMIRLAEFFENNEDINLLEVLTEQMCRPWPNTYTFSKALSEELVHRASTSIPVCIIRPSVSE